MGEELAPLTEGGAPAHLAAVARLRGVGDGHPLAAGLLPEARNPAFGRGGAVFAVDRREFTDDEDLLAVDRDGRRADEPVARQASGEPGGGVIGAGQVGLLPPTRTGERATAATARTRATRPPRGCAVSAAAASAASSQRSAGELRHRCANIATRASRAVTFSSHRQRQGCAWISKAAWLAVPSTAR